MKSKFSTKNLLVISQVYTPDPASVGQHVSELVDELVLDGWDVTVLTSKNGYDDPKKSYPLRESSKGLVIRRFYLSSFGKRSLLLRVLAQLSFTIQTFFFALFWIRPDTIFISTSPPFVSLSGALLAKLLRAKLYWWVMDINPDQLCSTGKLSERSLPALVLDWMNRVALKQAKGVITLDKYMGERLNQKVNVDEKLLTFPPWASLQTTSKSNKNEPTNNLKDESHRFREEHGLVGKFVVMYSGNHTHQHPLQTVIGTAAALKDYEDIVFVFVGGGAAKNEIDELVSNGASNIVSLPYQPLALLRSTLSSADIQVVVVGEDTVGIVHPCKIYSALYVGCPILLISPYECPAAEIVRTLNAGWQVEHGDDSATKDTILKIHRLSADARKRFGEQGAAGVRQHYSRERLLGLLTSFISSDV